MNGALMPVHTSFRLTMALVVCGLIASLIIAGTMSGFFVGVLTTALDICRTVRGWSILWPPG